jgi:hypothetical protein
VKWRESENGLRANFIFDTERGKKEEDDLEQHRLCVLS